jgi:hypothetical protein
MPSRPPGPLCTTRLGSGWVDSGTSARVRSEPFRPAGSVSAERNLVLPLDLPHRLLLAAQNGLPHVAPELRSQIANLLTLENLGFLAAFVAADLMFAGTGVGLAVNVIAGGMTIMFVGTQGLEGGQHLFNFYRIASKAKTSDEFDLAGREFAQGVSNLGMVGLTVLLARRAGTETRGKVSGKVAEVDAEASWGALADAIEFDVPTNQGIIFAGKISPAKLQDAILKSRNPQAKIIGDTATKNGWTAENMNRDFGGDSATTYRLWERLSIRYAQSLKGRVTAYVNFAEAKLQDPEGMLHNARGAGPAVEMTHGKGNESIKLPSIILTELEELMTSNRNITFIQVKDIETGTTWRTFSAGAKSPRNH